MRSMTAGALAYMDGANLNAILGRFKPGEAGFDVMHFNVHKTFSTPHGGGGPGAGPVGVGERLLPYLPRPRVLRARRRHVPSRATGRASDIDRPAAQLRRQHRRPGAGVCLHPRPRRVRACARSATTPSSPPTTSSHGWRTPSTCRTTGRASTSSWPRRRAIKNADRRAHARHRQAAHRLRLPPADDLLPADRRRGDAHRADRDRIDRDARRVRRRAHRHRRRRPNGIPGPGQGAPRIPHRSSGWTRPPRPASRTCAGGRWPGRETPCPD